MKTNDTSPKIRSEEKVPPRVWLWIIVVVVLANILLPILWNNFEKRPSIENSRQPYHLSKDYWHYEKMLEDSISQSSKIPVTIIGDSVVWGEYVDRDSTLTAYLNERSNVQNTYKFLNAGINGLYPVVLKELIENYYPHNKRLPVILHYNFLWISNPEADLQDPKERTLNHSNLLPQFFHDIPPYKAPFEKRLKITVSLHIPSNRLAKHIQISYVDNKSIPNWTMDMGPTWPPNYPNSSKNISGQFDFQNLSEHENDPSRGKHSSRHKSWNRKGMQVQQDRWIDPTSSIQWPALLKLTKLLQEKNLSVFVIIGPLNKHMMDERSQNKCSHYEGLARIWLKEQGISHVVLPTLPSELYADSSHPLSGGYNKMAEILLLSDEFSKWLNELDL